MHSISLNIYQFILLLIFIYVFSYYWTPKSANNTEEYLALMEKHEKTLALLKKKTNSRKRIEIPEQTVMGKHVSAHSNSIRPSQVGDTDNGIVEEMLHN